MNQLVTMSRARWEELERNPDALLTAQELNDGWRFCVCEFDGLLIHKNDPEAQHCGCLRGDETLVPLAAVRVLGEVRQDYPDAFIAGGYLRDLYFEKTPKDLDIFTFQSLLEDEERVTGDVVYEENRLLAVANRTFNFDIPVQIIQINPSLAFGGGTPHGAVSHFALGLQQIYYDGISYKITDAFLTDARNKTLTATHCTTWREANAIRRKVEQLKEKYPGYTPILTLLDDFPEPILNEPSKETL